MQGQLLQRFLDYRLGRIIGIGLFSFSLFLYRSYENRPILDRWSYPYFTLVVLAAVLFLLSILEGLQHHRTTARRGAEGRTGSPLLDAAILLWGAAYFTGAIDNPPSAARIMQFNVFGSSVPAAACLEWIALVMFLAALYRWIYHRTGKHWLNVLLTLGTVIIFLLLAEGVIRFRAIAFPTTQGYPTYTTDLWGRRYVKYNRAGFRDREHSLTKEPDTRRLLVIGDSYAFGWGIESIDDRFGSRVCRELSAATGERWEAINISRGDTHTLDHIKFLKRGLQYEPDVVILLYVFNDIDYLYPVTPRMFTSVLSVNAILYKNSYLYQELYIRLDCLKYRYQKDEGERPDPYADRSLLGDHFRDLSAFASLAAQNGAVVEIVPFDIRVLLGEPYRNRYSDFIESATASRIPVLSLENAFDDYEYSELTVNNLDRHPNELANAVAAKEIAQELLKEYRSFMKRGAPQQRRPFSEPATGAVSAWQQFCIVCAQPVESGTNTVTSELMHQDFDVSRVPIGYEKKLWETKLERRTSHI